MPAPGSERPAVVAVVGSPRRGSNSAALVAAACDTIALRDVSIAPCLAHDDCADYAACPLDDDAEAVLERVYAADCLILGTPVYYENVSAQMKAFIDRNLFRYSHDQWLRAAAVGLVAVTAETGLRDALEALRRYVGLSSEGEIPIFTCGGCAGDIGEAAGDATLLSEARAMGRALAEELGLTPA